MGKSTKPASCATCLAGSATVNGTASAVNTVGPNCRQNLTPCPPRVRHAFLPVIVATNVVLAPFTPKDTA
jgi:hypothetical protein